MTILFCSSIFTEEEEVCQPGVSPAGNQWICNLVAGLRERAVDVDCIGHVPTPLWPKGHLAIHGGVKLVNGVNVKRVSYVNMPLRIRSISLRRAYRKSLNECLSRKTYDLILSYNLSAITRELAALPRDGRPPWISILADSDNLVPFWETYRGEVGEADGHVFLSWKAYCDAPMFKKLHMDGGIVDQFRHKEGCANQFNIVYAGNFGYYAGAPTLISAFKLVKNKNARLLLCGKGDEKNIRLLAAGDERIQTFGTLSRAELLKVFAGADMFVNPRPSDYVGNEYNFPSKILEYLGYRRPILSTWTAGLSPDYASVLSLVKGSSISEMSAGIQAILDYGPNEMARCARKIEAFVSQRGWGRCAEKLVTWAKD